MKLKLIVALIISAIALTACNDSSYDDTYEETVAYEEIDMAWYMDSETLKRAVNVSEDIYGDSEYAILETENQLVYAKTCSIWYSFHKNGLEDVTCYFNTATDKEEQKETLESLKSGLTEDYGEPDIEETMVNGSGLPCYYVEWYTESTHIMMTAYLEKSDDFEVTVYFSPTEYKYSGNDITSDVNAFSSEPSLIVPHGKVLDVNVTGNILVVKAKITPSFNNHSTISQNFFNLEDLIKNQGCSKYDEIQYWAVADMTDGSESKVISFTVPKSTIDGINDGSIEAIAYLDEYGYVTDVYILPSLLQD